ncbi:universal stress protein [Aromatoleum toluclasticum]|uniref:universal stress protein n=1 Tax=Aromatoleum toluclasticum TaxID=92003 RepID=UPI0018DEDCAD|nr:universal stress protein [Aromatoleum toluclasticum]
MPETIEQQLEGTPFQSIGGDMQVTTDFMNWEMVERDQFGRVVGLATQVGGKTRGLPVYRVLAPVDGSPASLAALRVAASMAGRSAGSALHVLNVQTIIGNTSDDDTLMDAGLADTEDARRILGEADGRYHLQLTVGNPAEAILAYARRQRITEIVMGADGAGSVACALLGSVALEVLESTDIAVTLVKSRHRARPFAEGTGDLLVVCDGSAGSLRALQHALEHTGKLTDGPRIHLLNVHRADDGPFLGRPTARDADIRSGDRERAFQAGDAALRTLDAARANYEVHVAQGDPVDKILELATSIDCGRIVMASHGLGWFAGLTAGSISWSVLYRTVIPITLVK